ncbi:uncharacterized protein ACNS7B_006723 isoform 2-T2 [Menidia menidia]
MFSPSCRRSSPFLLTDLDMWDTKSHFTAQTSAWCGMSAVSGSGYQSKVSTRDSGFGQSGPSLRRWQSLSHLAPEKGVRSSLSGAAARVGHGESSFRQAGVRWLSDARERLDTQQDHLRSRDMQLSYNTAKAQMFDMKQKQLSKVMSSLEQAELPHFKMSQQCGDLHEKVLKMENELLQMKSTLAKESMEQPARPQTAHLLSRILQETHEDYNKKQKVDSELCNLREALREAEAKATTHKEELNKALQHLETSTQTQRTMLNQIEEMMKLINHDAHNRSEVQQQLSEADNKISKTCLDKAVLSTQVLKLEDSMKELEAKLIKALREKDHLIQEKEDLLQRLRVLELQLDGGINGSSSSEPNNTPASAVGHNTQDQETVKEETQSLREVNDKLRAELEKMVQSLDLSQSQLQELQEEKMSNSKQITDLKEQCALLLLEKQELVLKMNPGGNEVQRQTKKNSCQHSESMEPLEVERQKLQDQCLCLEAQVQEREDLLRLQEEEYRKRDKMREQHIDELKAVTSHWAAKWQQVALALQSTQEELEHFKKNKSANDRESGLLKAELGVCKQELEQERRRNQALSHRYEEKGGESVKLSNQETQTDSSDSSLLNEPPSHSLSCQHISPQGWTQCGEVQRLKHKLEEKEKELSEREHALRSLERLREMERTEAQIKISTLEFKLMKNLSENCQDVPAGDCTADSRSVQLDESRGRADQLQQEKMLAVQKPQTLKQQLYPVKDEKPSVEGKRDKTLCPVNPETELQRRMVTEQLKSLFKEREGKEAGKMVNLPFSAQTGSSSSQDRTPTSLVARAAAERRNWQQGSSLTPVFEEDENCEWTEEEEDETHSQPIQDLQSSGSV